MARSGVEWVGGGMGGEGRRGGVGGEEGRGVGVWVWESATEFGPTVLGPTKLGSEG